MRESIERAIAAADSPAGANRWSDSVSAGVAAPAPVNASAPALMDVRETVVTASAAAAFAPIRRIGGETGWYCADFLWRMRGWVDLLAGGVGMRRGRRDAETCVAGDPIDFWRVAAYEPDHLLRLEAEMKVPGRAWLEFTVDPVTDDDDARSARWRGSNRPGCSAGSIGTRCCPLHAIIFSGMLRRIGNRANDARVVAAAAR